MTQNWLVRNIILIRCGSTQQRGWFGRTNIFPRSWKLGMYSKTMWNKTKYCGQLKNRIWITNFRGSNGKITMLGTSATSCLDERPLHEAELGSVGELSTVCSRIVLKCLYLARIVRPDILWFVNKLSRAVTKWTTACDKRLSRLISYIHHANDYRQYCFVGNTAQHCRLNLFQDSDFLETLKIWKSNIWSHELDVQ